MEIYKRRNCAAVIIRGIVLFCFLGLLIVPALVRADEWGCDNMTACLKNLEDKAPDVRRYAAANIRSFGQESKDKDRQEIIAALKRHLQDTDNRVRYRAAVSLTVMDVKSEEVLPVLYEMLKDKDEAKSAALALAQFGPGASEGAPVIIELMNKEGISWFLGYPHSTYADVLRDIGTPEALAAVKPLRRMELAADVFYAPFIILLPHPVLSLLTGLCFAVFFWRGRAQYRKGRRIKYIPLLIPALGWGSWGLYMINKDMESYSAVLFLVSWILFMATMTGVIPWLISWLRTCGAIE